MNTLYYNDNLQVLRQYIKDEPVDLIYLAPTFNYNLIINETPRRTRAIIGY